MVEESSHGKPDLALVVLTFGGAGYKYVKEALSWSEEEDDIVVLEE